MDKKGTLIWYRRDLRISDHTGLQHAIQSGGPIWAVYIHHGTEGPWAMGQASQWWLHHSLKKLSETWKRLGGGLIICQGEVVQTLNDLLDQTGAKTLCYTPLYESHEMKLEEVVNEAMQQRGVHMHVSHGDLLYKPGSIRNKEGSYYKVFTPFWRSLLSKLDQEGMSYKAHTPKSIPAGAVTGLEVLSVNALNLKPKLKWADGFSDYWEPGERGAWKKLKEFEDTAIKGYKDQRDFPWMRGTSRLSAHLHFGEIHPWRLWGTAMKVLQREGVTIPSPLLISGGKTGDEYGAQCFLREVGWREFAHHLLACFPETPTEPLQTKFKAFEWVWDAKQYDAWCHGQTGYPIVDAGMRELWATGWMHNRVRMIVASFLVKDLRISWLNGAKWFWDTLVDADLANNTLGWQWAGGCGADAAPYFRIFNPVSQGQRWDKDGAYVRKWCPELSQLPNKYLHCPYEAPAGLLNACGIALGVDYPKPIVDHKEARDLALEAFAKIKSS